MGSIRARNETGKLFFDFKFQNIRCREQTTLEDNKANRCKLQKVMDCQSPSKSFHPSPSKIFQVKA
jgi:hypothetical protein